MTRFAAFRFAVIVVLLAVLAGGIATLVAGGGPSGGVEITVPQGGGEIRVHVSGAVAREGVYALRRGDRVIDAVEAAGGLLADADTAGLNLAARLNDGERVHVPRLSEAAPTATPAPLDLNRATAAELEALPGIGERRAQAILDYRTVSGGFDRVEDLLLVEGIGPATLEALRPLVVVR